MYLFELYTQTNLLSDTVQFSVAQVLHFAPSCVNLYILPALKGAAASWENLGKWMQMTGTIETKWIYPQTALFLIIILHTGMGGLVDFCNF